MSGPHSMKSTGRDFPPNKKLAVLESVINSRKVREAIATLESAPSSFIAGGMTKDRIILDAIESEISWLKNANKGVASPTTEDVDRLDILRAIARDHRANTNQTSKRR